MGTNQTLQNRVVYDIPAPAKNREAQITFCIRMILPQMEWEDWQRSLLPLLPSLMNTIALEILYKETKTIEHELYSPKPNTTFSENPKQILYPDSNATTVMYQLNNAGQIEVVSTNTEGSIVTNIDYSPTGTPTRIEYANGVITTQTYDINQLYRLTAKQTRKRYQQPPKPCVYLR